MPRVLLLLPTTTYRTQDFMTAARRLGVEVTVASEEPSTLEWANPAGLLTLKFKDPDQAARDVARFATSYQIDAVVPVDDQVTVAAAIICQALGLRHNSVDSALAARCKLRMRELLQRADVRQPWFRPCSLQADPARLAGHVCYPCVVKPLTLSASCGVMRANDETEFVRAVQRLAAILQLKYRAGQLDTPPDMFLAEEFVAGQEVALEGLLSDGRLRALALFDKPDPMDGPFFEETIYVTPSRLPALAQQTILDCTAQAARALGLSQGPIHAELRINDPGPWIMEINARSIGGLCSRALRFGAGVSLEELIIRHALDPAYLPPTRELQPAGVMMIPIPQAGVLNEVHGLSRAQAVPGIEQVTITARLGQQLEPLPEGSSYLGFIFARAASPEAVEAALRASHDCLDFCVV